MPIKNLTYCYLAICTMAISCSKSIDDISQNKLFSEVPAEISGITFTNKVMESEKLHYYKYLYIYIGGGVAAADFNNDGLQDLFFTSNIYHNKLFLNKGNFKFEDITIKAGIKKRAGFDTGVSVADVNNDGFLDIYINRAGWYNGEQKLANMLYVNNGDLTFTEKAEEFGLADTNRSIASTFFDYDNDGDLDVYIANAPSGIGHTGKVLDLKKIQQSKETAAFKSSDKLYRNDDGHFIDVSIESGILPEMGFGLNAQVGDLNNDGLLDIYVSNDFIMPDFAYINNGNGTFTDKRNELFKHISYYSMGADIADVNNDGLQDMMVLDMSPEDYIRSKTTMSMMSIDRFHTMVANDHHYQYMHNVLQLNNGKGNFSEIAQLSGIAKTDWSWSALFADFDLDGYDDLYVTNGIYRDVVDRDVNNEINKYINQNRNNLKEQDFYKFTQKLPQQKLTNYLFKNEGDLTFSNTTKEWSDLKDSFSNGAVYVDLDNDGDLDIVTNNLDENATILKNNSREHDKGNYLQVTFDGPDKNPFGAGAKVDVYGENGLQKTKQLVNSRGYLSSTSNKLHFGLGQNNAVDSLKVTWLDGKEQKIYNVKVNQLINIEYGEGSATSEQLLANEGSTIFTEEPFNFSHDENDFNDFDIQLLLPHKLSRLGPAVAKADLNNDGVDDIFLGAAHNEIPKILVSDKEGNHNSIIVPDFIKDRMFEDVAACFFDVDNDGDKDLYVTSGSYEFIEDKAGLQDRLYINHGNNNFKRARTKLPTITSVGAVVIASDYDQDGDEDLFIGGRVIPGKYPYAPKSTLLLNEGKEFRDATSELALDVEEIGMVTTAEWADIDNDGDQDLIVSGEWMGIEVLINEQGKLSKNEKYKHLSEQTGWWNKIVLEDLDNDGDLDIITGNLGLNYKFHASPEKPFHVYTNDFDKNGIEDIVLAKHYKEKLVPVRGKNCTSQQIPYLKEKIKTYQEFANSDIQQILGEEITNAVHLQAVEFRSGYFMNNDGQFQFVPFAIEAQLSPINSIVYHDFDNDSVKDLVLAGNNYGSEVETTRADAGVGTFLKGIEGNKFAYQKNLNTGFYADGDVRGIQLIKQGDNQDILVINNNGGHQLYKINKQ
ncbi:VCBS repeat-containing protein [Flagellimonas pacifica]|uniref:Repeat domain-containing protein n=1 Tax=Flagellimonas pacifica TaxID=1247520 RepID=A0A285MT95_9FLAO|nr:VCBS repeat-containing protein [Allomuricauda parva]SNZ00429.1 Repeat domain-containing protein [Allomuricauda parva]